MRSIQSSATALLVFRLQEITAGLMPSLCLKAPIAQGTVRLSNNMLVCLALNPLLSWLTPQLRCTQNTARDNMWEYPQQPHRHPRPAIIPGEYLVWELFLPSSCSLWPAGFQCLRCGSASLDGLYGTEESRRQLQSNRQHLRPTQRALPWCCTLIAQKVWNGSTCAGARYELKIIIINNNNSNAFQIMTS